MEATDKPQRNPDAKHEVVDEEAILINAITGAYYSLNDTGTMFWELLDGERTIADCAGMIAEEYEVEAGVVEEDLIELSIELENEGLIIV